MKTLTRSFIFVFAGAVLALTAFGGPEAIMTDSKDSKTVVPVPPPCNWQGFYVGLNAGGSFADSEATSITGYNGTGQWSYDSDGFVGGLEAGYNYQWNWLVLGVEGDVGYLGLDGSAPQPASPDLDTIGTTDDGIYATFRARIGASLWRDKLLAYVTGGGMIADNEVGVFDHRTTPPAGNGFGDGSSDNFRFGWIVGGGLAYAINCHWSIKTEVFYYRLDKERFTFHEINGANFDYDTKIEGYLARAGLDFRF